ncbi:PTS sugar transporter subunit IIA, partial [Enterococcus faecalis]
MYADFIHQELIFFNSKFTTKEQFFEEATKKLKMLEYVEDSFESAIMTREMSFPTGLELGHINIAIPHTDPQHVKKPFVAAYQLNNPIEFVQMATTDSLVPCELILILGITDPKNQVGLLSTI